MVTFRAGYVSDTPYCLSNICIPRLTILGWATAGLPGNWYALYVNTRPLSSRYETPLRFLPACTLLHAHSAPSHAQAQIQVFSETLQTTLSQSDWGLRGAYSIQRSLRICTEMTYLLVLSLAFQPQRDSSIRLGSALLLKASSCGSGTPLLEVRFIAVRIFVGVADLVHFRYRLLYGYSDFDP